VVWRQGVVDRIAAIALAHDLILITHNLREFSRVDGLNLEDWET
jgi:tRNA(fMet)-specific endonuclease VapC